MNGSSTPSQAPPTKLYVYVDETVRELPGGRRLLGAGALIVTEPVGQELIDSALSALDADPDRAPSAPRFKPGHEKRDLRTLSRRYFHASDDSVNARSVLARAIKARVRGKFECSFAEGSKRSDQQEFGRQSISAMLPAWSERLPLALVFEQRSDFSRISAEALIEYMNRGLDWTAYDLAMMRTFYPRIDVRVEPKKEPGLQVADLLLWGALQDHLEPASLKARITGWCGGFRWAHGGAPFINAKYFVNHRSPALTDGADDRKPLYPVEFEALDHGDGHVLANVYCLIERTVRQAAVAPLPPHVDHLRPRLLRTVRRLRDPERVGPEQITDVVRAFLRLFDTLPLYEGFERTDPRWLPLVRAKRMAGLCLREDLWHGGSTVDFFATVRRQNAPSNPSAFGITANTDNMPE